MKLTKENTSELISENQLIFRLALKIAEYEVVKVFSINKNNIEVVSSSSADFDQMLLSGKGSKDISRIQ